VITTSAEIDNTFVGSRQFSGRKVIYSSECEITSENVIEVLKKAVSVHLTNSSDINYLYRYYRGNQPILQRVKKFRPEINNKIVENHALEIVDFKKGDCLWIFYSMQRHLENKIWNNK
jgi:hypothetical protein